MKILVIGPSWIGDMMMSQSLYRTLKSQNPNIIIDVIAPAWCHPLLSRMPEVNEALLLPLGHDVIGLSIRWRLGQILHQKHYDQAFVLPGSLKSALIPFFAKIPHRIGWRGEMRYGLLNDIRVLNSADFPLMVQRYIALCYPRSHINSSRDLPQPLCMPTLKVQNKEKKITLYAFKIYSKRPIIGFCPGAESNPLKKWPHYHYSQLAEFLIKKGYQVLLLGSTKDRITGERILLNLSQEIKKYYCNLAGKTDLQQAIALLSCCHTVISNDSGLMHIAAALDRPLIALYGPSNPNFTPPLSKKSKIISLVSGCYSAQKRKTDEEYHPSLIQITPEKVMMELKLLHYTCRSINASFND
ncbi:lipopolysaccharide heptosyltransferase II [Candidatus Erwinia haradaeae]|uniref:lipopolysaccharide heptosyltransferase II n=1 Tax=Candidatus Erwinia haradaeae TaxID=1922217 RepID=A0A451DIH6_9GAMM|nr:lipopolysaccharide heptosyltransferase II [Candidatus Erwinia haradaeae]VFP86446.1 ADP-heptose--LPS heptosyltransferase 2 [Candidatus Erwinia haradaeae]